jgi:hypothetical protein
MMGWEPCYLCAGSMHYSDLPLLRYYVGCNSRSWISSTSVDPPAYELLAGHSCGIQYEAKLVSGL